MALQKYIGLISGTSMDGVDAALVEFDGDRPNVVAYRESPYPQQLRSRLDIATASNPAVDLRGLMTLHIEIGRSFADAALALLADASVAPEEITAIGSHGQTLLHSPQSDPPFTLQLGDPATIAIRTGITTVADLRSMDMAAGGQGAPFVPAFHAVCLRSPDRDRAVVNIGGIANVTLMPAGIEAVTAFDSGPGNCLMDEWCRRITGNAYDSDGQWAAGGTVLSGLLKSWLSDPYFARPAPKSTGRDYFNLDRVTGSSDLSRFRPEDVQATVAELTARSIADAILAGGLRDPEILLCGGGAANRHLGSRIGNRLSNNRVASTAAYGIAPNQLEAIAFAWFAKRRLAEERFPAVITGASRSTIAGAVYIP